MGWPQEVIFGLFLWRRYINFSANSSCSHAKERRLYQNFLREISEHGTLVPSDMTQSTLVETCHHNLQTSLLTQMGVEECHTWKKLALQGEQGEEIIARVRAEEKDSKPRPDKSMQRAPESSSQPKRRDIMATEVKSPPKTQSIRGGMAPSQHMLINYIPLRMSMWYLYISYSKRVTDSNFWRLDTLKR